MSERDYDKLKHQLDETACSVLRGLYQHYKGGRYEFERLAVDKETEQIQVLYHHEGRPDITWTTSVDEWTGKVETENGLVDRYVWLPGVRIE